MTFRAVPFLFLILLPTGVEALDRAWKHESEFSEGVAAVHRQTGYGYIDTTGALVIQPRFDDAGAFGDGRAMVGLKKEDDDSIQYGYIDHAGTLVIPAAFQEARRFTDGLAAVHFDSGKWGFIDKDGHTVMQTDFAEVMPFSEGRAVVMVVDPELRYGFIDRNGAVIIPPRFLNASEFCEGLAAVQSENGKWGFINPQGKTVIAPTFDLASAFVDDRAAVAFLRQEHGRTAVRYGYIDHTGAMVIPVRFGSNPPEGYQEPKEADFEHPGLLVFALINLAVGGYRFSEGLAPVEDESGKVGYINRQGAFVLSPQFDVGGLFSEGLARVEQTTDNQHAMIGYIDKTGKLVIPLDPQDVEVQDVSASNVDTQDVSTPDVNSQDALE